MNAERPSSIDPPLPNPWPPGYVQTSYGNLLREDLVRPQAKLEDQAVNILIARAAALHDLMADAKRAALADVAALLDVLAETYGVRRRGGRGGVEMFAFNGCAKVQVTVADSIQIGPEISAAKDLIDECIAAWSTDANPHLRTLVDDAFKVGATGKIAVDKIRSLRRLKIDDPIWLRAMLAIDAAMRKDGSKSYIRFYRRETPDGAWAQIALDFAGV